MEGVLIAQQALVPVLENTATAIAATLDETWTLGLVASRLELLDRYWRMFEENHVASIQAGTSQENPYFAQGTYSRVETVFVEAKGRLFDAHAGLRPEASQISSAVPLANSTQLIFQQPRSSGRLPRITGPEFSGRREDWGSFRDLFRSLIHDEASLSDVDKLFYLKANVKGDALSAINSFQVTSANYATAWRTLEIRYDNSRLLVQDHIQALKNIRPLKEESTTGLQRLQDELRRHRDQLKALGRSVQQWDDWLVSCAVEAMDPKTRRAWETALESRDGDEADNQANRHPNFDTLIDFLGRRCRTVQALEQPQALRSTQGAPRLMDSRRIKVCAATFTITASCAACQGPHQASRCPHFRQLSLKQRKDLVSHSRLCYNCLGRSHVAISCPSQSTCRICGKLHHTLLHDSADKRSGLPVDSGIPTKVARDASLALLETNAATSYNAPQL